MATEERFIESRPEWTDAGTALLDGEKTYGKIPLFRTLKRNGWALEARRSGTDRLPSGREAAEFGPPRTQYALWLVKEDEG
jgi:hypothetical protein